jgi:predicted flap endonuclease-1-like 5' DNA nuclease
VKKVIRFLGVLAGLGTLIWVMRDRFVSLALPREPEPPAFRVAPQPEAPTTETPTAASIREDLTIIKGIGPVYAARLEDAGIESLGDLASAKADTLSAAINVPAERIRHWIDEAAFLSGFQGH